MNFSNEVLQKYEVYDFHHASTILKHDFPDAYNSLQRALESFSITVDDIKTPGGSKSPITKKFSQLLFDWLNEQTLTANVIVDGVNFQSDTHKIDFLKDKIALDFEWNSKDQTYDRDLFAFRSFWGFNKISLGIIVTRSDSLDKVLRKLTTKNYGASTTRVGKLIPRIESGRNGGCPILVFAITENVIDYTVERNTLFPSANG